MGYIFVKIISNHYIINRKNKLIAEIYIKILIFSNVV